jgi:hypothetical protein
MLPNSVCPRLRTSSPTTQPQNSMKTILPSNKNKILFTATIAVAKEEIRREKALAGFSARFCRAFIPARSRTGRNDPLRGHTPPGTRASGCGRNRRSKMEVPWTYGNKLSVPREHTRSGHENRIDLSVLRDPTDQDLRPQRHAGRSPKDAARSVNLMALRQLKPSPQ